MNTKRLPENGTPRLVTRTVEASPLKYTKQNHILEQTERTDNTNIEKTSVSEKDDINTHNIHTEERRNQEEISFLSETDGIRTSYTISGDGHQDHVNKVDSLLNEDISAQHTDTKSQGDTKIKENKSKAPIDTGWAWVVLFACTLEMFIVIGVMRCYGIFFLQFQQKFHSTSSVTSLISTLQNATYSLTGLFVMTVALRFISCRKSVIFGGILTGMAYIVTAFLEDIGAVMFINGVLVGLSLSFVYAPMVSMLSTYFEKYLGLANSISCAGVSLGGLLLAPLFTYLFEEFGYSGTMLLTAGIHFNIAVGGMLLRPIEFYTRTNRLHKNVINEDKKDSLVEAETDRSSVYKVNGDIGKISQEFKKRKTAQERGECDLDNVDLEKSTCFSNDHSTGSMPITSVNRKEILAERQFSTKSNTSVEVVSTLLNTNVAKYASADFINTSLQNICNSCTDRKEKKQMFDERRSFKTLQGIKKLLGVIFDFSILKDQLFLYYLLCTFFLCSGNAVTPFYLAPHAKDIGIDPERIAVVLMIQNIVDLFARIFFGFISDRDWLRRSTLIALSSGALAISNCLVYFVNCYVTLMIFAVIIGLLQGIYFSLFAVVIVDYLSLEKLNSALGFCTSLQGLSVGCTLPVAGYLRDVSGTYVTSYAFVGFLLLVGTFLIMLLPAVKKWQLRRCRG